MTENEKKVLIVLVSIIAFCIIGVDAWNKFSKLEIDAVSSISTNTQEELLVVANCNRIKDKAEFAGEVLQKYIDNSFHSVRLSTDLRDSITCLKVTVYLKERQIEDGDSVMEIEYRLQRMALERDIRENPKQVDIFIDGEKIDG